jgi:hypothetical protein
MGPSQRLGHLVMEIKAVGRVQNDRHTCESRRQPTSNRRNRSVDVHDRETFLNKQAPQREHSPQQSQWRQAAGNSGPMNNH